MIYTQNYFHLGVFTSLRSEYRQAAQVPTCLPHFHHPWWSSMPE
ncbi:MAG: hypothetical protein ABL924_03095 [Methyloglobulus sp.]